MNVPLMRLPCLVILLMLTIPSIASAATFQVPSAKYHTIQAGIDAAQSGDTVLVGDGTYRGDGNRDLDFKGKSLTVKSVHGAAKTILDCQGSAAKPHRGFNILAVNIPGGELAVTIMGLTVEHSYIVNAIDVYTDASGGGGVNIHGQSVSAVVTDCVFIANNVTDYGGGGLHISCHKGGSAVVTNCTFIADTSAVIGNGCGSGGGAFIEVGMWCTPFYVPLAR